MNLNHKERKKRLYQYLNSLGEEGIMESEKEYARYSVFRLSVQGYANIVQFQIFKDGTIMRNGREVLNWRESEKLAA